MMKHLTCKTHPLKFQVWNVCFRLLDVFDSGLSIRNWPSNLCDPVSMGGFSMIYQWILPVKFHNFQTDPHNYSLMQSISVCVYVYIVIHIILSYIILSYIILYYIILYYIYYITLYYIYAHRPRYIPIVIIVAIVPIFCPQLLMHPSCGWWR